jgi:hypothetical protein
MSAIFFPVAGFIVAKVFLLLESTHSLLIKSCDKKTKDEKKSHRRKEIYDVGSHSTKTLKNRIMI